ncbi:MAG TPA: hypothetical protein VGG75_32080 [Trebonia sp.]
MRDQPELPEYEDEISQQPRWEFRPPQRWRTHWSRVPRWCRLAAVAVLVICVAVPLALRGLPEGGPGENGGVDFPPGPSAPPVTGRQAISVCSPSQGACSLRLPPPTPGSR